MKSFEINALGLQGMSLEETIRINGGMPEWLKKVLPGGFLIAAWQFVNDHWDAICEGFERGTEEGVEKYF